MTRNAYAPTFRAPWLPSRAERLAAFRVEQERYNPRPPSSQRGYGVDWRALRREHLADEPYCRACARNGLEVPAVMVDHIKTIRDAPERRLDPSNLQSLCYRCHMSKTQRERRRA
jgi:5-methylcytosine-specific restriction endonuclease McrA